MAPLVPPAEVVLSPPFPATVVTSVPDTCATATVYRREAHYLIVQQYYIL